MNAKKPILNLILLDKRWAKLLPSWEQEIACALDEAVKVLKQDFSHLEVSVVLAEDEAVRELNKTYRHKDKPTNVLSFPSEETGELGDIILAYETVKKEAEETGISFLHHTLHLIVHGFLHLLGYNHEENEEAHHMETMEIQILKKLGIANPYEDL
jgi:probable rRNA maturation factor